MRLGWVKNFRVRPTIDRVRRRLSDANFGHRSNSQDKFSLMFFGHYIEMIEMCLGLLQKLEPKFYVLQPEAHIYASDGNIPLSILFSDPS